jgi:hypothetical protein
VKEEPVSTYYVLIWLSLAFQAASIIVEMIANRLV